MPKRNCVIFKSCTKRPKPLDKWGESCCFRQRCTKACVQDARRPQERCSRLVFSTIDRRNAHTISKRHPFQETCTNPDEMLRRQRASQGQTAKIPEGCSALHIRCNKTSALSEGWCTLVSALCQRFHRRSSRCVSDFSVCSGRYSRRPLLLAKRRCSSAFRAKASVVPELETHLETRRFWPSKARPRRFITYDGRYAGVQPRNAVSARKGGQCAGRSWSAHLTASIDVDKDAASIRQMRRPGLMWMGAVSIGCLRPR